MRAVDLRPRERQQTFDVEQVFDAVGNAGKRPNRLSGPARPIYCVSFAEGPLRCDLGERADEPVALGNERQRIARDLDCRDFSIGDGLRNLACAARQQTVRHSTGLGRNTGAASASAKAPLPSTRAAMVRAISKKRATFGFHSGRM